MRPNQITTFADLEREEIRLKMHLRMQEDTLKNKLKTLPEEVVIAGATKVISGVINGSIFSSAISIVKFLGASLMGSTNPETGKKGGILNLIKEIIKSKISG